MINKHLASLALHYIRLTSFVIIVVTETSYSAVQKCHSKVNGKPIAPSLYSILLG